MAQVSAADITKLRKTTGAGMMDCKKALEEADNNFEKAIEIIRKRGQAIANKRADKEAAEGATLAGVSADGTLGAIIQVSCETDFVSKNDRFVEFVKSILDVAIEKAPASLDALKALPLAGKTVADVVMEQVAAIGERIDLIEYHCIKAATVVPYIHPGNQVSTLVGLSVKSDVQVGKDVAMQIAAMKPVAIDKDFVTAEVIEKEREIGRDQARQEGKPENMLDRIAEGKLQKFFKENTLLNQDFIKDNKMTVSQYLKSINKDLTVTDFRRFSIKE